IADNDMEEARHQTGLEKNTEIAYSDDSKAADLLIDNKTGLRGRPDQIVIVDGEFIPMEQKTGKIPHHPHLSHKVQLLAYIHLVKVVTKHEPPFGVLRYGETDIHQVDWNDSHKKLLMKQLGEVQRLMAEGGAKRNHQRDGKCRNCSRRHGCTESLV
ncbi:MAG: Dna2/Cas4 domain-containing protein, partial [Candidatus Poseidoniaceae archaeon]|nr:Dna2/Cas4 domain-containing protein [Candidatus Poseidoniaceae archaeon]